MSDESLVDSLLLRWEELRDSGTPATPEELCEACPEVLEELRQRIAKLDRTEARRAEDTSRSRSPASSSVGADNTSTFAPGKATTDRAPPAPGATIDPTVTLGRDRTAERPSAAPGMLNFGPYVVERELGRGGMGVVYLARQPSLDRHVALKMIVDPSREGPEQVERFLREAQAVGRLQHENIIRIHEIGRHEGRPYFSLEFVDGPSLAAKYRGEVADPQEAAEVMRQVALGVACAHESGIVHRDLKPANILLTSAGIPKVADFGLAKRTDTDSELSRDGMVMGTPSYMPPEQARGERDVGPPADVYALGATLYSLLTGRPPFVGATPTETVLDVLSREPTPPRRLRPQIPADLETICLKCLRKSPEHRYGSATELAEELQRFCEGRPILARPVGRVERFVRWCRRSPVTAAWSITASLLLAVLAVGGPLAALVIDGQRRAVADAKGKSDENFRKAQVAEGQALESAELARERQGQAIEALKTLVFDVQRRLGDQLRMQPLRRALLATAERGLASLESEDGGAASGGDMVAAAIARNLGEISQETGRSAEALSYFQRCREILEQLDQHGRLPFREHNLSEIRELLARAEYDAGKLRQAREHLARCLEIRREWLARLRAAPVPDDERERATLQSDTAEAEAGIADAFGGLGDISLRLGDVVAARDWHEQSLALRVEQLLPSQGKSLSAQLNKLGAERALALIDFQEWHWPAAIASLERQVAQLERFYRLKPDSKPVTMNLGVFSTDLGAALLYAGRTEDATRTLRRAVEVLGSAAKQEPDGLSIHERLATAQYGLAVALEMSDAGPQETGSLWDACVSHRTFAVQADPENHLRLVRLGLALARSDRAAPAKQVLDAARRRLPTISGESGADPDPGELYQHACLEAQVAACLARAGEPGAQAALDESRRVLDLAKKAGYARDADLTADPDLAPLRDGLPPSPLRPPLESIESP